MYQFFVEPGQINTVEKRVTITGNDVNHIKNVLRMKPGEEVNISNGIDGKEYRCLVQELLEDSVVLELCFIKEDQVELPAKITLFQGLPKADKMELIIQKCVELGVYKIVPMETKRCVVKLDDKKAKSKVARWQAISEAAAKQSKRAIVPEITAPIPFTKALDMAAAMDVPLLPYEMAEGMEKTRELIDNVQPGQTIAVMIGPEGGFDEKEINLAMEKGVIPITLGKRILRTETAGFTVLSWLMYRLEQS